MVNDPNDPNVENFHDVGDEWEVSESDAAMLDAFESGGVEALNEIETEDDINLEEVEGEVAASLMEEIEEEAEEPAAEDDSDLDEDEEADDAEADEEEETETDGEEVDEFFYVDGPRGQKLKVPTKPSQDELAKMAQAADRAKLFQSKLDKQKADMDNLNTEIENYKEEAELFRNLESLADDLDLDDPSSFNSMIRAITNDQIDMDTLIEAAVSEREELALLTDDQIGVYEKSKELKRREREIKKQELRHQREKERAAKESANRMEQEQRSMISNALLKHDVRGKLGDQARENGIMERAWNESLRKMNAVDSNGDRVYPTLSPDVVEEIIKGEIEFFGGPSKKEVETKVDKIVKRKRASATKAVQNVINPKKKKGSINSRAQLEEMSLDDVFANMENIDPWAF